MWSKRHFPLVHEECLSDWKGTSFWCLVGPCHSLQLDLGPKSFFETWHHKHSFLRHFRKCGLLLQAAHRNQTDFELFSHVILFLKFLAPALTECLRGMYWGGGGGGGGTQEMLSAHSKREPGLQAAYEQAGHRQLPIGCPAPLLWTAGVSSPAWEQISRAKQAALPLQNEKLGKEPVQENRGQGWGGRAVRLF